LPLSCSLSNRSKAKIFWFPNRLWYDLRKSAAIIPLDEKASRNAVTVDHLALACRHFEEMVDAGVTENGAIRTLELFADVYAKVHSGGSATPHHVSQVDLWSLEAKKLRERFPEARPRDCYRVEHGTPRRGFARKVLELYREDRLSEKAMVRLVKRYWKLAVITLEEDRELNKVARSKTFETPEERWAAAGIKFSG